MILVHNFLCKSNADLVELFSTRQYYVFSRLSCRPCAMVVPDFELICEIMLVAEGFIQARLLARKFITLYQLCKELLSKQVKNILALTRFKYLLQNIFFV